MGDPVSFAAFVDELEKMAVSLPGLGRMFRSAVNHPDMARLGQRLKNPVQGLREGWQALSPTQALAAGGQAVPGLQEAIAKQGPSAGFFRRNFGAGAHLAPTHTPSSTSLQGGAETLSRAGWTGQGRLTKYLPIGEKGLVVGGSAMAVPGVIRAARGDESHGGLGEQAAGVAGGLATGVLTAGTGLPGMLAGTLGTMGAMRLGLKIDEMRRQAPQPANLPQGV